MKNYAENFIFLDDGALAECVLNAKQRKQGVFLKVLGLENMHGPDNVLSAYWAFAHALPAFGAGDHVTALQQHTVDDRVHADSTQVIVIR